MEDTNTIELVIQDNINNSISIQNSEDIKKKVFETIKKKNKKKILTINTELNNNTFNYNQHDTNTINDNSDLSDSDSLNDTYKGSNNSDNDVLSTSIYREDLTNNLHSYKEKKISYRKLNYREVVN